jgi:phosphomannomutase
MGNTSYLKLQNGSDIRGVAIEGVEGEPLNLDENAAAKIGFAFAKWLKSKQATCCGTDAECSDTANCSDEENGRQLKVSVGRDPRLSGEKLAAAFSAGLVSAGIHVFDCGLASTPAMFMSTIFDSFICDGAVMITASHLPYNRNGFKFFDKSGGLNKGDIKEILTMAGELDDAFHFEKCSSSNAAGDSDKDAVISPAEGETGKAGSIEKKDLMKRYCLHLCELIGDGAGHIGDGLPLSGLKIVVDAGNGAGGFYADNVLAPLGAEVIGCFLEPDGNFPNHIPNPENKEAMASISGAVKEHGADLGIIFDTDVDRSAAVDENGHEIARNGIVALAAALVEEKHPGTTVVTDSITSDQLTVFLEKDLGMKHLRFKRGYRNVINKAIELNEAGEECHLAIETSGHAAIKENHFLDDGAYLATLIVIRAAKLAAEGKKISSMISSLEEPADATEVRMKISCEDFGACGDRILSELEEWIRSSDLFDLVEPNYEGVRANYASGGNTSGGEVTGWFLLRKSLHDPIMPLNIEANQPGGCKVIAAELRKFLAKYEELDTGEL